MLAPITRYTGILSFAQRQVLGDYQGVRGFQGACARARLRLQNWSRRVVPWVRTKDDPWDAAIIVRDVNGIEQTSRLDRLSVWRPRTRTLLMLDDPGEGYADENAGIGPLQVKCRKRGEPSQRPSHSPLAAVAKQNAYKVMALERNSD